MSTPLVLSLGLAACGDDSQGSATETTTESSTAGETEGTTTEDEETSVGTTEAEPGGDLRGLVTFTYYPADAAIDAPTLGLAGAYRWEPLAIDDLFALFALQLHLPPAPATPGTIDAYAPLPFVWDGADTWLAAGNGIRLRGPSDTDAVACQLTVAGYPRYLAATGESLAPVCAPDPAAFIPASAYDLVLYGGELFDDQVFSGRIATPPALAIQSPDLAIYNLEVDTTQDLTVTWTPEAADAPSRIILRVWDQYDQGLVATASDDGEFTIPAAELATLSVGPGFLTIAREREHTLNFSAGSVRVLTRYEQWGYVDLI